MRWLRSLRAVTGWGATRARQLAEATFSLVPNFFAAILWQIASTYPDLARRAYGSNAIVYSCLRLLCQSVAEPPLVASTEDSKGELTPLPPTHPLPMLIDRPNELMTQYEMLELIELHVGLSGGSWWWKQRNNGGQVSALWPLRPDRIVQAYQPDMNAPEGERLLRGWAYYPPGGGKPFVFPRSEILAFGTPDPAGETGGIVETLGWVQVLATEIAADNEATEFVGALLANYAQPSMLLKTKTPIRDPEIAKRLKAQWMAQLGGSHRGEPALLDADTEVEKLSFDLKQLEFPDLRAQSESRVSAAAGVPSILVGLKVGLDASTYSNFESAREFFTETTLSARWRRYSDQFTNDLGREFGPNIVCRFDTSQVKALAGQRQRHAEPIRDAFDRGAVTLAQYVKAIGQTLPDGVNGNVYYVPTNTKVVRAEDLGKDEPKPEPPALPPPPPQPALPEPSDDDPTDEEDEEDDEEPPARKAAIRALVDDVQRRSDAARVKHADPLTIAVRDHLAQQRERVLAAWNETAKAWPSAHSLLPDDDDDLTRILQDAAESILSDAVNDAGATLGIGISFDLANDWVQEELDAIGNLVRGIASTTREILKGIIGRAAADGLSIPDVAALIREATAFSESRAETISLTETARAYNAGALRSYEESGLVDEVEVLDGDFDETCKALNGQKKSLAWAKANLISHPRCKRAFAPIVRDA